MNKKLLKKYAEGKCSPEEIQRVLQWFEAKEPGATQKQGLHQIWQEIETKEENKNFTSRAGKIFASITEKIEEKDSKSFNADLPKFPKAVLTLSADQWKKWLKVAAAILFPVFFCWVLFSNSFASKQKSAQLITEYAQPGKRKSLTLGDGTKINLNAGSKIHYLQPFPKNKREIILYREAFFEVCQDSLRPFIVRTGILTTKALGTSFNIKYRVKEQDITVALATGSVRIETKQNNTRSPLAQLEPGQQLVYNKLRKDFLINEYDSEEVLSWREGALYFKKATIKQVIAKLEAWYGVELEVQEKVLDEVKDWNYNGVYYNKSLKQVLDGIAFVKDFTYEIKDNKILIRL